MKTPYMCVCCGYETYHKPSMRNHLYNKKKLCPKIINVIELTDEIKEHILNNRVYHVPQNNSNQTTINQIINYNNTINNFISNMDTVDKINKIMNYQEIPLIEYGDTIEHKFANTIKKLETGYSDYLTLDKHNLLEVIDQVSSLVNETFENLNIVYDEKFNKLKLYESGQWNESILISGIRILLMKIQGVYFDPYECYLIRKIEYSTLNLFNKQLFREKLVDYYKFLGSFEIDPYAKDKNDTEIKYNIDDDNFDCLAEYTDKNREVPIRYMSLYVKTRDDTKKSESNKIKKDIIDIVKKNSRKNVDELNKKVFAMFNMDEEFKNIILSSDK
jgi:hypothetical protein